MSLKYNYVNNNSDPVFATQYIINEEDQQRNVIFKFKNNYKEILTSFSFIVTQMDVEGEVVAECEMEYNDFIAKSFTEFVPKLKLLLSTSCVNLIIKVVTASFETVSVVDGEFVLPEVEEVIDPSTLHYFHNRKLLYIQKPSTMVLFMLLFIVCSLLVLYLYFTSNIA